MAFLGDFEMGGTVGPERMFVFDDGILVTEPPGAAKAGLAFGAMGGLVGGLVGEVSGRRLAQAVGDAIAALPEPSAHAVADQVKRVRLVRADDVATVTLEKGFGKTRKIVVAMAGRGKDLVLRFGIVMQPEPPVSEALATVFGDRFRNAVARVS